MKFFIKRVILWFSKTDKNVIPFENNKVNVIRGNSSRGKSNIFAIIDYCLMSDKPSIVEPVINECTEYYGLEFVLDGEFYAIARKKPDDGVGADGVYLVHEPFADDFYPTYDNMQVSIARSELDRKFGIKDDAYKYPYGNGGDFVVSFRSFLMYNALTENIIDDPFNFFNYKFFEDNYVDKDYKRDYLLDMLLGIDNVEENKQQNLIDSLKSNKNSTRNKTTRYNNAVRNFVDKLNETKQLVFDVELAESKDFANLTDDEQIAKFESLLVDYQPYPIEVTQTANTEKSDLAKKLYQKQLQLNNILRARREYEKYREQLADLTDNLKPVEFLKDNIDELGLTPWSRQIIDSLKKSLESLRERDINGKKEFSSERQIELLRREIHEVEEQMMELEKIRVTPIQNSERYFALGRLKENVKLLKYLKNQIPANKPEQIDEVHDNEQRKQAEEIIKQIADRRATVVNAQLNPSIQHFFDKFTYLENFEGSPVRYNREHERLEIGKDSVLSYTNIGSQSNYMYLHVCFFLGLHHFLLKNPSQYVGQFLFIDQPSKPYYESSDDTKSNDKLKLLDAFKVINSFMAEMDAAGEEFQIIMIEHAEKSYWTGENALPYFVTTVEFEGNKALVPIDIIQKHRNETKN